MPFQERYIRKMNMFDTKKCFRGILFWREDVLKCAMLVKKPLSEYVRELLHSDMKKHRLDDKGSKILNEQIAAAKVARESRKVKDKRRRVLTVDKITIPAKVRNKPQFVKG